MAIAPVRNPRSLGNSQEVIWTENFSQGRDKCKANCRVQIMNPRLGAGPFNQAIIVGLEPRHKNIRFLSVMPRQFINVPHTTLNKVIKQTRGIPVTYWQRDRAHIQNATALLRHMKLMIRTFC